MELLTLQYLPLQEETRRIVLTFLRKVHPTALLIKELTFERLWAEEIFAEPDNHTYGFLVRGGTFRIQRDSWIPWSPCSTQTFLKIYPPTSNTDWPACYRNAPASRFYRGDETETESSESEQSDS